MASQEHHRCRHHDLPPHVLIFPFPAQGHLHSMLNLAHLLCLSQFHVTFIVSEFSHRRLLHNAAVTSNFSRYPGFRFKAISDGLPDDHPRAGEKEVDIIWSVKNIMGPLFKKTTTEERCFESDTRRRVTCIIADGILEFAADFAEENGIPLVYFRTASACSLWAYFCIDRLIDTGEIPFTEDKMDELVKNIPGTEGFLRRRDLPSFCRANDVDDPTLQAFARVAKQTCRAQALILNTFDELEGPIISHLHNNMPTLYTLGPIHTHLKSRLAQHGSQHSTLSGGFWPNNRSCMDWLNAQPPKSVIYVSFGSTTVVTRDQLLEFWHGLVNSGQRFLWVLRPNSIKGDDGIPLEFSEGSKERGFFTDWAPQVEVLSHPAIGAFFTHSGWNSTMESIGVGVPMICWSYFADQTINSRFVSEVWNIGLDIKDNCDRKSIEKGVRIVMDERKDEFLKRAKSLANLANEAIREGGTSYKNLDNLIQFIRSLILS